MLNKERFMFGVFTFRHIWFPKALFFIFNSCMDSWALDKLVWRIQWILQNSSWKWVVGLSLCIWLCTCTWRAMQNCETATPCDQYKLYVSCIFSELVKTHCHPCRHGFLPSPFILPPWKHRFDMLNHPICSSRNFTMAMGFYVACKYWVFYFQKVGWFELIVFESSNPCKRHHFQGVSHGLLIPLLDHVTTSNACVTYQNWTIHVIFLDS